MAKIDDSIKKKVPELRFKGFTDNWEERKFKDILKTHSFRSYLAGVSENGEYEVIQQGDKPIVGYSDGEPFTDYKDVTLFGDHTVSLYKPKSPFFVATDGVKILSADNFEGDYLYTTLEHYKPEPQGYKRHFTILKNQDVWFTENMEEQQKIGEYFSNLDHLITLHQRKLDLLKEQKKGFLQKMFPKNGAKVPELRFAGFADDWEERKLNENVENIGTGRSSFKAGLDYSEQTPYEVLGSTSVISYSDSFDHSGNFVLTARVGANAGNLYKHSGNVKISDNTVYIQSKNLEFIFYLLTKYDLKKLAFGTGQPLIKASELKNLKLFFPKTFGEQQKIGSFFKQLDDTIALHQRKLDLLKEQKKGFLQKMFV